VHVQSIERKKQTDWQSETERQEKDKQKPICRVNRQVNKQKVTEAWLTSSQVEMKKKTLTALQAKQTKRYFLNSCRKVFYQKEKTRLTDRETAVLCCAGW